MFARLILLCAALLAWPMLAAPALAKPAYVMISGWGLYPDLKAPKKPATVALATALSDIARADIKGIVYGSLGLPPRLAKRMPAGFDAQSYNRALFALAKAQGAGLWLQLRYYDNWLALPSGARAVDAAEVIADADVRATFLGAAMAAVADYQSAFPDDCVIILGEEETIYHERDGSGLFWAGQAAWDKSEKARSGYLAPSPALDQLFVDHFSAINGLLVKAVRKAYPACSVGIHIGHASLTAEGGAPEYAAITGNLPPLDFTFYDLYDKVSPTEADFRRKLAERVALLKELGQRVYFLAQLHTTNAFGHGGGRTPSAADIDGTAAAAMALGVDGFGYYTKNAMPTVCTPEAMAKGFWQNPSKPDQKVSTDGCSPTEDLDPLDPNTAGQKMVYQNALGRWRYGLAKLKAFTAAR
jgi:hypothetical protein